MIYQSSSLAIKSNFTKKWFNFKPFIRRPDFIIDQATAIVDTIIQQAGATRGCFSFAFRVAKDGALYLIEVHSDLGGEFIMDKLIPEYFEQPFLEDLVQFIAGKIERLNYLPKVIRPMIQGVSINIPKVS